MVLVFLLALALIFSAVALAAWNLLPRRGGALVIRGIAAPREDVAKLPSAFFRGLFPLLDLLAPLFKGIRWPSYRQRATLELQKAGFGSVITTDHLLAMKALSAIVTPFVLAALFDIVRNPALFAAAALGGFYLPDRLVADRRKAREREILRALPGSVDVLSLSVEAGLEFLTAIQRLVERGGLGALREELATILNDIRLGKSRGDALKSFSQRVEIPEVSSFVSVLVQADMLGASIGPVLQQQAERMRVERFQRAEKAGARASQKILFPLVLFIFPAVLIVIIGPVALQFIYGP